MLQGELCNMALCGLRGAEERAALGVTCPRGGVSRGLVSGAHKGRLPGLVTLNFHSQLAATRARRPALTFLLSTFNMASQR